MTVFLTSTAYANSDKMDTIDTLRAELSYIKDKSSPQYIKTKQKLEKEIIKNKIDYSNFYRLSDAQRLISQKKFNSAIYELNELINFGYELSKCNELLGDIGIEMMISPRKIANYYKISLQYDRDNLSSMYKLSKLYLSKKKNILAIEYIKKIIEKTNDIALLEDLENIITSKVTPQNRYESNNLYEALGNIYIKLNRKNDSYEAFAKALQTNPRDIYLRYFLAELLYNENENRTAVNIIDTILQENPHDDQIKVTKAKSLARQGKIALAEKEYQEILSHNPYSNQAKYGIYELYKDTLEPNKILNKIYSSRVGQKISSQDYFEFSKLLKDIGDKNGANVYQSYALNEQEEMKKIVIARQDVILNDKMIKKPKILDKRIVKKTKPKQIEKKNIEKKTVSKKEIKNIVPTPIIKKEVIKNQQNRKETDKIPEKKQKNINKNTEQYEKLKQTAQKYLSQEPKTAQIYIAVANTHKQMGELNIALSYFKKALKLEPTNSDIYYNIGLTNLELNNSEDSKTYLTKAINLDENNEKAKTLLKFVNQKLVTEIINKSFAKFEKKEYVEAFEILDDGIKEYPKHAQLYYYRSLIYDAMNRNAAAIIDLQKAIELDGSYYMAYYQLGHVYEKIKDERSALVAYEKFLSTEPDEKELIKEVQEKVIYFGEKYY